MTTHHNQRRTYTTGLPLAALIGWIAGTASRFMGLVPSQ